MNPKGPLIMQNKSVTAREVEAGPSPAGSDAGPRPPTAAERDLEAFERVSRASRRAVAETIRRLVRPA